MYYNARKYYIEEVTTQQNEETLSLLFPAEWKINVILTLPIYSYEAHLSNVSYNPLRIYDSRG